MKSFQEIYREEIAYVWRCLGRLGVDEKNLEDKAHDVFVIFYKRYRDFDVNRPVRPWLCGIAARVALDFNRLAYRRREVLTDRVEEETVASHPEAALDRKNAQRQLLAALSSLDMERRSVFVLHDLEGRNMREIAEFLDVPQSTLYSRLNMARQQLNTLLGRKPVKRCGS
ncbi:MAG: sigma-70 family RNA polymerase sigma factor [Deltaproteobacteria bacterium]|nr:sigma-70 family RNA polymerase sigma factor [Deltaproteobacteria bacterium]